MTEKDVQEVKECISNYLKAFIGGEDISEYVTENNRRVIEYALNELKKHGINSMGEYISALVKEIGMDINIEEYLEPKNIYVQPIAFEEDVCSVLCKALAPEVLALGIKGYKYEHYMMRRVDGKWLFDGAIKSS